MISLEEQIKVMVRESGAALVGIGSRARLDKAPISADAAYLLPSTHSFVSFAIPLDRKVIRDYLSKKKWLAFGAELKRIEQNLCYIADRVAEFLRDIGYEAVVAQVNQTYRHEPGGIEALNQEDYIPDFSHRYAAVAAGLGWLGWSGNLLTQEYGAIVLLGSILTSAVLEPDPLLVSHEDHCEKCKACVTVCPTGYMSNNESVSVNIGGLDWIYAKRGIPQVCVLGCTGYHSQGRNKKWSTWSPYRLGKCIPEDKGELIALIRRIRAKDPERLMYTTYKNVRGYCFDPDAIYTDSCALCQLICWEKLEDRKVNRRILFNSGTVVLTPNGQRVAVAVKDTVELETPFELKVAVPREEYHLMTQGEGNQLSEQVRFISLLDKKVIEALHSKK